LIDLRLYFYHTRDHYLINQSISIVMLTHSHLLQRDTALAGIPVAICVPVPALIKRALRWFNMTCGWRWIDNKTLILTKAAA